MKIIKVFFTVFLVLVSVFFSSCSKKVNPKESPEEILKGYFSSDVSVVSKDGKLSFILSDEKITVTSPGLLKGAEVYFKDGEAKAKLGDYEISLPKTFVSSIWEIFDAYTNVRTESKQLDVENGIIRFENSSFELEEESIIFKTKDKEFIIQRNDTENDKDQSNG